MILRAYIQRPFDVLKHMAVACWNYPLLCIPFRQLIPVFCLAANPLFDRLPSRLLYVGASGEPRERERSVIE